VKRLLLRRISSTVSNYVTRRLGGSVTRRRRRSPRREVWRVSCLGRCLWFVEDVQLFDGAERKVDDDWRVKKSEDVSGWSAEVSCCLFDIN